MPGFARRKSGKVKEKYLVMRRDGSVPAWPWFVLGGRDPAAPAALAAYADECERLGMDAEYVKDLRARALEFIETQVKVGRGDPDRSSQAADDPLVVAKLGEAEAPEGAPPSQFESRFEGNTLDVKDYDDVYLSVVQDATVLDGNMQVAFKGTLYAANMVGFELRYRPGKPIEREIYRERISKIEASAAVTMVFESGRRVSFRPSGIQRIDSAFGVSTPIELVGKEIYWVGHEGQLLAFWTPKQWSDIEDAPEVSLGEMVRMPIPE